MRKFALVTLCLAFSYSAATVIPNLGGFLRDLYWTSEDLGVQQIAIPGRIDSATSVLLHIFLSYQSSEGGKIVKGFFFAEATDIENLVGANTEDSGLSPWGHSGQPKAVKDWAYPVTFTDKDTGQDYKPQLEDAVYEEGSKNGLNFRFFPAPFSVKVNSNVICVDVKVKNWLHMAEVCLTPKLKNGVGFAGVVVYCSPSLLRRTVAAVMSGSLKLILWDHFNSFQRLDVQKVPFYEIPDQILINNHALLAFGSQPTAVLFLADMDEFFVPRPPSKSVVDVIDTPSCVAGGSSRTPMEHQRSWGSMELQRRNYRSALINIEEEAISKSLIYEAEQLAYTFVTVKNSLAEELSIWLNASTGSLDCHPLVTYNMYQVSNGTFNYQPPKQLLRAMGGVHAWHVHYGISPKEKTQDMVEDTCGFVLHAVNLWNARVTPSAFDHPDNGWRTMLPDMSLTDYKKTCLSPYSAAKTDAPDHSAFLAAGAVITPSSTISSNVISASSLASLVPHDSVQQNMASSPSSTISSNIISTSSLASLVPHDSRQHSKVTSPSSTISSNVISASSLASLVPHDSIHKSKAASNVFGKSKRRRQRRERHKRLRLRGSQDS
eukprot:gene5096-34896_t